MDPDNEAINDGYAKMLQIAIEENSDISAMENLFQNSISHIANLILSKLIDKEIPHNIIMTNQGKTFYLIPRKFEDRKQKYAEEYASDGKALVGVSQHGAK